MDEIISTYHVFDSLASEYYDERIHLTCCDFFQLSKSFIESHFCDIRWMVGVIEIVAGRSVCGEIFQEIRWPLSSLTITDASCSMLLHSQQYERDCVGFFQLNTLESLSDDFENALDVVVASIGDPCNFLRFRRSASLLLQEGGSRFSQRQVSNRRQVFDRFINARLILIALNSNL